MHSHFHQPILKIKLRWNNAPGNVTQINSKLFDYEKYNANLTVHCQISEKFAVWG